MEVGGEEGVLEVSAGEILVLVALALGSLSPAPLDMDAFTRYAAPVYADLTGAPAHRVYAYWTSGGSFTAFAGGGCGRTVNIAGSTRGRPESWWHLAHETAHTYQGAACQYVIPYRDGRWLLRRASPGLVNVEQTAQFVAMEVLATACRDDYPGACWAFWKGLGTIAGGALLGRGYADRAYFGGVVDRMGFEINDMALPARSIRMDDAWALISSVAQLRNERWKRSLSLLPIPN